MSLSDDLVAWWSPSLTYVSSDADCLVDLSGNGYDGTYNGGMGTVANTESGGTRAFLFDGSNDYLSVAHAAGFAFGTGPFSISYWIKHTTLGGNQWAIDKGFATGNATRFITGISSNTSDTYMFWANGYLGSGFFSRTSWVHYLVSRTGTTVSIYTDGVFRASGTYANSLTNTDQLVIGARSDGALAYTFGLIDQVAIWSADKSAFVSDLYNGGRGYDWRSGSAAAVNAQRNNHPSRSQAL